MIVDATYYGANPNVDPNFGLAPNCNGVIKYDLVISDICLWASDFNAPHPACN